MDPTKAPGIKFLGVDLLTLDFSVTGEVQDTIPLGLSFTLESEVSEENRQLDLYLTVDLFGRLEPEKRPSINFTFSLRGRFQALDDDSMPLDEFCQHHAPANLMPYVRELVANITTRSPLPTLNLGPVNVIALVEEGRTKFEAHAAPKRTQET